MFALQFLAAGVNSFGQPGVLVTLEEPAEELIANMSSFGWDLAGLVNSGQIAVIDATDRGEEIVSGGFDFGGLSARIAHAVRDVGVSGWSWTRSTCCSSTSGRQARSARRCMGWRVP